MSKREESNKLSFEYNEQGTKEVSEQIVNAYNSGFIGEGTALADRDDFASVDE